MIDWVWQQAVDDEIYNLYLKVHAWFEHLLAEVAGFEFRSIK